MLVKHSIQDILTVCRYTVKELYQSKILFNIVILGSVIILISYITTEFTYGTQQRVALDFGSGMAALAAVGIAIFGGANLISSEIESRTLYLILSRPISRNMFILGKIMGMTTILFVNVLVIYGLSISIYFFFGGEYNPLILWVFLFTFLESAIILILVVFLSLIMNKTLSILNGLTFFVLGHAASGSLELPFVATQPILQNLIKMYTYIFPNLSNLNIRPFLIYKKSLSGEYLLSALGYSLVYSLALIILTSLVFKKKQLD